MVTYKQLKDDFLEEVGKIDISKLGLSFGGLKEYSELLKTISSLPEDTYENQIKNSKMSFGFGVAEIPKK